MLFASALLDDPGHSVASVGKACGYSGDQALRRALRAVMPRTLRRSLRDMGAFDTVSERSSPNSIGDDPEAEKR
jgi:hypothetical protein